MALYLWYVMPLAGFRWEYVAAIIGMTFAAVVCFQAADIYQVQVFRGQLRQMTRMISSWTFVFLLFIGVSFALKLGNEVSRLWLSSFFLVGLAVLVAGRLVLRGLVRNWARQGRLDRRTIIVGADENGEQLVEALNEQSDSDIHVLGVFDDRNDDRALDTCAGSPKLGKVDDIVEFARRTRVDLVLFALPISAEARILENAEEGNCVAAGDIPCRPPNRLRFVPFLFLSRRGTPSVFRPDPAGTGDEVAVRPHRFAGAAPRAGSGAGRARPLAAVSSSVPKAVRFNNERIDVFKFRSLYHHQAGPPQSRDQDPIPRTRIGRASSKTSLDELPQLFNVVFKSNLSLVGPRPHAVQGKLQNRLFDEAVDGYFARHRVKPGITGWAQVNGWRGEVDTDEKIQKRVEFDLYYIENWSVIFDLYILLKTPFSLLTKNENAY